MYCAKSQPAFVRSWTVMCAHLGCRNGTPHISHLCIDFPEGKGLIKEEMLISPVGTPEEPLKP